MVGPSFGIGHRQGLEPLSAGEIGFSVEDGKAILAQSPAGGRQPAMRGSYYTAASFKAETSALLLAKLPSALLFGGGLVVKIGDEVVGAITAAGARLFDHCARAGLEMIRDRVK